MKDSKRILAQLRELNQNILSLFMLIYHGTPNQYAAEPEDELPENVALMLEQLEGLN